MMTHKYTIDHRFDEVHSRMLSELWDSIVFEGRASIDTFLAEVKRLGFIDIVTLHSRIPTFQLYAMQIKSGFIHDHQLQETLMQKDMVRQ